MTISKKINEIIESGIDIYSVLISTSDGRQIVIVSDSVAAPWSGYVSEGSSRSELGHLLAKNQ